MLTQTSREVLLELVLPVIKVLKGFRTLMADKAARRGKGKEPFICTSRINPLGRVQARYTITEKEAQESKLSPVLFP